MNAQEALQLLVNATANLPATRMEHAKIVEAIKVLEQALKPKEEK